MQYLRLTLSPPDRAIHPVDSFIADHEDGTHEELRHVDARNDGTTVLLYRMEGDREATDEALAANPHIHDHEVVGVEEGGFHALVQTCSAAGRALLRIVHENAFIVDTPLVFIEGGLRTTLVGTHGKLRGALSTLPEEFHFTVDNAGPYVPGGEDLLSPLIDRQLEVFETAVEQGYYDVPRRATHEDIANSLGCPSTVDEHLRKAESRVVAGLVQ
jgi:predicted DNA binding protein